MIALFSTFFESFRDLKKDITAWKYLFDFSCKLSVFQLYVCLDMETITTADILKYSGKKGANKR